METKQDLYPQENIKVLINKDNKIQNRYYQLNNIYF